jgi:hypothetical protein
MTFFGVTDEQWAEYAQKVTQEQCFHCLERSDTFNPLRGAGKTRLFCVKCTQYMLSLSVFVPAGEKITDEQLEEQKVRKEDAFQRGELYPHLPRD